MNSKSWFALLLTLVSGLLIGAAAATLHYEGRIRHLAGPEPGEAPEHAVNELARYLDLDPEQKQVVLEVFTASMPQVMEMEKRMKDGKDALLKSMAEEIKPVLNPDQVKKLDDFVRRVKSDPPPNHRVPSPPQ